MKMRSVLEELALFALMFSEKKLSKKSKSPTSAIFLLTALLIRDACLVYASHLLWPLAIPLIAPNQSHAIIEVNVHTLLMKKFFNDYNQTK